MPMTDMAMPFIVSAITGQVGITLFDATNTYLGIGDSNAAFVADQEDLQAATNKFRKLVNGGYPSVVDNIITVQASYDGSQANFIWNEWGIFNAATGGVMLCRKVESNGQKEAGQNWVFEVELTIALGVAP